MNKKILTSTICLRGLIVTLMCLATVSASLGTFRQNECVSIKTILNSTAVNISTVSYPNSTLIILNKVMTKNGLTFNYSFCSANITGNYIYDYFDSDGNVYVNDFDITGTGQTFTTEKVWFYISSLALIVFLFIINIFIIAKLPKEDKVDGFGMLMSINKLKYLRPIMYIVAWVLIIALVFISSNFAYAYMGTELIADFLFALYRIMFWLSIPGIFLVFIFTFIKVFNDNETKRMLERGIDVPGSP